MRILVFAALVVAGSHTAAAQTVAPTEGPLVPSVSAPQTQALQIPDALGASSLNTENQAVVAPQAVGSQLPVARPRDSGALRQAIIATVAGNVFDSVTTIVGVRSGRAREVNPLLGQSTTRIVLMKTLFTLPQIFAEKHLVDKGHPKAARWVGYIVGGVATAVAIHNVQVLSR